MKIIETRFGKRRSFMGGNSSHGSRQSCCMPRNQAAQDGSDGRKWQVLSAKKCGIRLENRKNEKKPLENLPGPAKT